MRLTRIDKLLGDIELFQARVEQENDHQILPSIRAKIIKRIDGV